MTFTQPSLFDDLMPTPSSAAARARPVTPTAARTETHAPSVFDFDFSTNRMPFQPGEIVQQTCPMLGHCQTVFPYLQVLGPLRQSTPARRMYLCRVVPVSEYPGRVAGLGADMLRSTGLHWRVPDHHEVEMWLQKEWGINGFLAQLNFQEDGTIFEFEGQWQSRGGIGEVRRRRDNGVYVKYPPLQAEAELLDLMKDLPYQIGQFQRGTYRAAIQERAS